MQGRYNVEDAAGEYAHIVGGGTSNTSRKNIHTLDWDGNAYFAGNVTAGNTPQVEIVNGAACYYYPSVNTETGAEEKVWITPPMEVNEEYRTTEMFDGKPLYTRMVYLGYLTGTSRSVNVGIHFSKIVDLKVIAYGGTFATVLPLYGGGEIYAYAFMEGTNVGVSIVRDCSSNYAYAIIKYTK